MKKRRHITLESIAGRLKVSRVTVSKALRGHADISPEMTRRVQKLADELGYTPNIIARNLSARRSHMIGFVVPKIAHSFFGPVIEGVYNTAFARKYETILTVSQENADREKLHLQTLVAMRVDGIIISISQGTRDVEQFKRIRRLGIPVVFVDRRPEPPLAGFSSVLVDDRDGAYRAIEHAIRIGYRKLGIIGGSDIVNIGNERLRGFTEAMKDNHLPVRTEWVVRGGYGMDDGYAALKHLHGKGTLPECILAMTYPVALGICEAAKELGIRIPEDIDIICFGDSDAGRYMSPAISVICQPAYELGARAVQVLLEELAGPEGAQEHHVVLPTQLVLRETCVSRRAVGIERPAALEGLAVPAQSSHD